MPSIRIKNHLLALARFAGLQPRAIVAVQAECVAVIHRHLELSWKSQGPVLETLGKPGHRSGDYAGILAGSARRDFVEGGDP